MAFENDLYEMAKLTPVFPSGVKSEEYIVSEDFFYPLKYFTNEQHPDNAFFSVVDYNLTDVEENKYTSAIGDEFLHKSDCSIESLCPCIQSLAFIKFMTRVKIRMNSVLFSLIVIQLNLSKAFRKNILRNFFAHCIKKNYFLAPNWMCTLCSKYSMKIHVVTYLHMPKKNVLDYKWYAQIIIFNIVFNAVLYLSHTKMLDDIYLYNLLLHIYKQFSYIYLYFLVCI